VRSTHELLARRTSLREDMANAHLLVVDDEPNILTSLATALRLEGYAVDVAGGIRVAEDKLAKRAYDVLLLDVALPDGDGIDMLTRLRAARNDIPCIVMSGHGTIDAPKRANSKRRRGSTARSSVNHEP
jgi:DNA-binding NtrC family response regulator